MSHKTHAIEISYLLIMVLGGVLAGCTNERRAATTPPETVSNVSVIVAQKTTVPDWLEAVGTVRADANEPSFQPDDGQHRGDPCS